MSREKRPFAAIRDAKKFAEKMGCRRQENTDYPDPGCDLFVVKPSIAESP